MNDTKSLLASKTLWGVLLTALPMTLGIFGLQVADMTAFTAGSEQTTNEIVTLVGALIAIYGRFVATKSLVIKK